MTEELSKLERAIFATMGTNLARTAFVASGVKTHLELQVNLEKLEGLLSQVSMEIEPVGKPEVEVARRLFSWLWLRKPARYVSGGDFKLTRVIDAELDDSRPGVGNCLGLTLLFNSMALGWGLKTKGVYLPEAFGAGPHVFSTLRAGDRAVDIEHIYQYGFDYRGHVDNPQRQELSDRELIAEVYLARGNEFSEAAAWDKAIEMYERALLLFPRSARARLNKGLALVELGRVEEAEECFKNYEG
ncbi:MAG: tetratricopeptide repeat protein [Chloroflexi bacterium]|nr:tetratricopeptide repeat protein [Chloroflexota bacterium]